MNSDLSKVAQISIMLAQEYGKISEEKACEILGMSIKEYRQTKAAIAEAVVDHLAAHVGR